MNISDDKIAAELPKASNLLSELATNATNVCNTLKSISEKIKDENIHTEQGLSLLELKNHTFLSYLANLSYTSLLKLSGLPLQDNFSIENLVELRVVLERIRPLEDKLKYQIQKYIKVGTEGISTEAPAEETINTLDNIEDSDDDAEADSKSEDKQLYKIPRISQVHYPGEEKEDQRAKRERTRALSSSMLKDALAEYTEDPEVHHNLDTMKQKAVEKRKEIERYEEDTFTRINLTKKQKSAMSQMSTAGTLASDLLSFRSLEGFAGHRAPTGNKKKKLFTPKGKKVTQRGTIGSPSGASSPPSGASSPSGT